MGSGLGSVGLDRLVAAIGGVLGAAAAAALTCDHQAVPLAEVEAVWQQVGNQRPVFVTGA